MLSGPLFAGDACARIFAFSNFALPSHRLRAGCPASWPWHRSLTACPIMSIGARTAGSRSISRDIWRITGLCPGRQYQRSHRHAASALLWLSVVYPTAALFGQLLTGDGALRVLMAGVAVVCFGSVARAFSAVSGRWWLGTAVATANLWSRVRAYQPLFPQCLARICLGKLPDERPAPLPLGHSRLPWATRCAPQPERNSSLLRGRRSPPDLGPRRSLPLGRIALGRRGDRATLAAPPFGTPLSRTCRRSAIALRPGGVGERPKTSRSRFPTWVSPRTRSTDPRRGSGRCRSIRACEQARRGQYFDALSDCQPRLRHGSIVGAAAVYGGVRRRRAGRAK